MKTYGTNITYSTVTAQKPIDGICESFTHKATNQITEVQGEAGVAAIITHGAKGDISFSATPAGDVVALGVRAGDEVTISTIMGGKIIVTTSSAKWQRGQPMVLDAQATHYPMIGAAAEGGTITQAAIVLARTAEAVQLPAATVWYGVEGITGLVEGIVQSYAISESVQIAEEEDAAGDIVAIVVHTYKATANMEILTSEAKPAVGTTLDVFGSFLVTSSEEKWSKGGMRSVAVEGICYPGVTSAEPVV